MKKALKIIKRLEASNLNHKFDVKIVNSDKMVIYKSKENQILLQTIHLMLAIAPMILIYLGRQQMGLIAVLLFVTMSLIGFVAYFMGPFQTNNKVVVDLVKGEITVIRKGFFGHFKPKNKFVKIQACNEIVKQNIPFWKGLEKRITLKCDETKVPLFDLKQDSQFDQIVLSLKLLVKGTSPVD